MPSVNPFARAVELIAPGASCNELARHYRVAPISISRWRRGLRKPPHWLVERMRSEIAEGNRAREEAAQALIAAGHHSERGLRAMRAWQAQRAKDKAIFTQQNSLLDEIKRAES